MRGLTSGTVNTEALAAAVILRAIKDYLGIGLGSTAGNKNHSLIKDSGRRFLNNSPELRTWAAMAGSNAEKISKIITMSPYQKRQLAQRVRKFN